MNAILLVGGFSTRLYPCTHNLSKHLLPVYDKPMFYYPLSRLIELGVDRLAVIVSPSQRSLFESAFLKLGLSIPTTFIDQPIPHGIAQALVLAKDWLAGNPTYLALGDNIFLGDHVFGNAEQRDPDRARIWVADVSNPESYGVLHPDGYVVEKPKEFVGRSAVTGMYWFPGDAAEVASRLLPSSRGEYEITDVINVYIHEKRCDVSNVCGDWLDAGTPDGLLESSEAIRALQLRSGKLIGSPEIAAYDIGTKIQTATLVKYNRNSTSNYYLGVRRHLTEN